MPLPFLIRRNAFYNTRANWKAVISLTSFSVEIFIMPLGSLFRLLRCYVTLVFYAFKQEKHANLEFITNFPSRRHINLIQPDAVSNFNFEPKSEIRKKTAVSLFCCFFVFLLAVLYQNERISKIRYSMYIHSHVCKCSGQRRIGWGNSGLTMAANPADHRLCAATMAADLFTLISGSAMFHCTARLHH